jgi:hypothetical protein
MKLDQAVQLYGEYQKMNSGKNSIESYGATLAKFREHFGKDHELAAITSEEILSFLNKINEGGKQQTKHEAERAEHLQDQLGNTESSFRRRAVSAETGQGSCRKLLFGGALRKKFTSEDHARFPLWSNRRSSPHCRAKNLYFPKDLLPGEDR